MMRPSLVFPSLCGLSEDLFRRNVKRCSSVFLSRLHLCNNKFLILVVTKFVWKGLINPLLITFNLTLVRKLKSKNPWALADNSTNTWTHCLCNKSYEKMTCPPVSTVTAAFIEFGLDNHGGNEMGSFACLVEESLNLRGGGHVTTLLKSLTNFFGWFLQHHCISREWFARRSNQGSIRYHRFSGHRHRSLASLFWVCISNKTNSNELLIN